jgi:hypothetical protein
VLTGLLGNVDVESGMVVAARKPILSIVFQVANLLALFVSPSYCVSTVAVLAPPDVFHSITPLWWVVDECQ